MWTAPEIQSLAHAEAIKYGLNPTRFDAVIECESGWNKDAIGDHGTSYGLVQIHLPDHPEISIAQATDPGFAIDWAAKMWRDGHAHDWSCYAMTGKSAVN